MALGRCHVETWTELGFTGVPCSPKLMCRSQTDVFLCFGCDEIYVFSAKDRTVTAVLQFPGPVSDLVQSHHKDLLYVSCVCGVYCVDLKLLLSSGADPSSGPSELKISSKFLVVPERGVLSLLLVGPELVTISRRNSQWTLTLYRSQKHTVTNSCEMLTSFILPLVSDNDEGRTLKRRPALICVHYTNKTPPSVSGSPPDTTNNGRFCIDPALFRLLFGIDTALAESPVVLCGLPDGCLYFLPLRLPGSRPRALCSLEQPVIFVGTSCADESGPEHAQCLVVVGEQGRVVLIRARKGQVEEGGTAACFLERCLPGSLMCGCIVKNTLYYSVGSDLLRMDLSSGSFGLEGQNGKEKASGKVEALHQSPSSLNVSRIIAVVELKGNTVGGEVQLLGLSVGGRLQRITVGTKTEEADSSRGPAAQGGRSVGDLLSAIGDVCDRASELKTAITSKSQVLNHLNHVVNISFLLTASEETGERSRPREKPIRCRAVTRWSRLLRQDSLDLTCVLDNSSPYALERGWVLSVCVSPLSPPPSDGGKCSSASFSFPFQSLRPGETLEVSLPLAAAGEALLPLVVSCSLVFSLQSLLGEEGAPGPRDPCITLPLNTLWVDWLHSLRLNGPGAARGTDEGRRSSVRAFINARRSSGGRTGGGRGGVLEPEQYSASVQVSSELLSSEPRLEGRAQSGPFLEWLLSEGCGGVGRGLGGGAVGGPTVHAVDPNGHAVTLTAREVEVGGPGAPNALALRIHSSDMAAVCGLHHAVLRRLQALAERAPGADASPKSVQSLRLRETALRAERLLQQIQHSRISGAFAAGASRAQMTQSLRSVYRDLRENPLIVL